MTHTSRPTRRPTGRRRLGIIGALASAALVLSGCSVYDLPLPGGADVGSNPMTVKAQFRDVLDLVPQSTVKVNDVTVGKVTAISLKGYQAEVTMELPRTVDLPDNARAEIRQTSLLGEKFISLEEPTRPSSGKLGNGDVIPLSATGRNPEVEEVLGALAALLNGGGVAQLKSIASELNTAFDGRTDEVRSVLDQLRAFMGQLDQNKESIVSAIENLNRLAVQIRKQDGAIKSALDNTPAALASIDRQREDLTKMLAALANLSDVGVKVINASKASTINSLRDLSPVLFKLAEAGQNFPRSLQVALTYPFIDEAVGRDPQVARNLHMGDYTNLSIRFDLNLAQPPTIPGLPGVPSLPDLLDQCAKTPLSSVCQQIPIKTLCQALPANPLCATSGNTGGGGGGIPLPPLPGVGGTTSGGGLLGLGRAAPNPTYRVMTQDDPLAISAYGVDTGLGTLLLQGVAR